MSTKNPAVTASPVIRVPPLKPRKIGFWFSLFERQFAAVGITGDEEKCTAFLACLESEYMERIEDKALEPPAPGKYERLKDELLRSLAESDSERVTRLVENEVMGDRKPSQFYHDLRKLASPYTSEQFILTLWKNRLPDRIRSILAVVDDYKVDKLIKAADQVEEVWTRSSHRASDIAAVSSPPAQNARPNDSPAANISTRDGVRRLHAKFEALSIVNRRRARSRSPRKYRRRSRSRDGLCYYHSRYCERALKCRSPCKWKQGNGSSRP